VADENAQLWEPGKQDRTPPKRRTLFGALRALLRIRIIAGLLTVIPIWVTWKVVEFVFDTMKSATEPIAWEIARMVQEGTPPLPSQTTLEKDILTSAVTELLRNNADALAKADPVAQQAIIDRIARKITFAVQEIPDAPAAALGGDILPWVVPVVAVLLTLSILYLLGFMGASVFGRRLIHFVEWFFEKLPLVKPIYKSTKQVVKTLGGGEMQFQRVVLVEFPRPGMKCIGFLTAVMKDMDTGRDMASIFVSTTPNPTTGYMQIVPLDEVSETNWTVEEAVKLLMSGGILSPPQVAFDKIHPVKWTDADQAQAEKARRQDRAKLNE
jgi:uncharacterized membrane protein